MAKPRKGRVPPQLRKYLFKKSGSRAVKRKREAVHMAKHKKRKGRHSFSGGGAAINLKDVLYSAGYGFVRSDLKSVAQPLIDMVPLGDYSDNVALAGSAYLLAKFVKMPLVKDAARAIVVNEAFLAGAKARAGASLTMTAGTSASSAVYL